MGHIGQMRHIKNVETILKLFAILFQFKSYRGGASRLGEFARANSIDHFTARRDKLRNYSCLTLGTAQLRRGRLRRLDKLAYARNLFFTARRE